MSGLIQNSLLIATIYAAGEDARVPGKAGSVYNFYGARPIPRAYLSDVPET